MAPIRRYLRITRYSVLEVRIYLDNPADAESWLLSERHNILPRVIEAIRPLVLPKLREENENAKRKGGKKKKGVRDIVAQDDFEVSIFLTETSTNHSLLTKQKTFASKPALKSNSPKLGGWLNNSENPISVDDGEAPAILREEDEEGKGVRLQDIPEAPSGSKRGRGTDDAIDVSDGEENGVQIQRPPARRRRKLADATTATNTEQEAEPRDPADEKKKMALSTAYEGFSIYGRVLCLIVKRKGGKGKGVATNGPATGSEMLANWVSTQAAQDGVGEMDDEG